MSKELLEKVINEISRLEVKRNMLHNYVASKLEERDYHAVADGAMDLREIEAKVMTLTIVEVTIQKEIN